MKLLSSNNDIDMRNRNGRSRKRIYFHLNGGSGLRDVENASMFAHNSGKENQQGKVKERVRGLTECAIRKLHVGGS